MATSAYTFGDGGVAARRLWHLGRVFAPTMAAVLAELPARRWGTVVDLGCGPGASTATLARLLDVDRPVGVDASAAFLALAAERVPGLAVLEADVTAPLPVAAPDLLYARYLLAHLPDPLAVVAGWRSQLADGGVLVVEDLEAIDTGVPVLREYLDLAGGLVASRGATMHVGPLLAGIDDDGVRVNRAVRHEVAAADAVALFLPNLASWRDDAWIAERRTPAELDDLADGLRAAGAATGPGGGPAAPVTWTLRQLVAG